MSAPAGAPALRELDRLPDGLLGAEPAELADRLGGPALIHLPGRREPALFVSVLLHGNEHTGWRAVQRLLAGAGARPLPRALSLFVGNVEAARHGLRRLDAQPDWNRVWPGTDAPAGPERALADAVTRTMRARGVFASVDVHNNTGRNPHYGCVSRLDPRTLQLAALFSRIAVHFESTPRGVQSTAFSAFAPSIAIECGVSGEPANDARAAEYLDACLHLSAWPSHAPAPHDLDLYRTVCTVRVADGVGFGFAPTHEPLAFDAELDALNFRELAAGTAFARTAPGPGPLPLVAIDDAGRDLADEVFERDPRGVLRLRRALMPAMLTRDARVIRQDCVGYLMERLARG